MKQGKKESVFGVNGCKCGCYVKMGFEKPFLQDVQCDTPHQPQATQEVFPSVGGAKLLFDVWKWSDDMVQRGGRRVFGMGCNYLVVSVVCGVV